MTVIELPKYAGRRGVGTFRTPVDVEEMAAHCAKSHHIWFKAYNTNDAREAKVNGAVRRWKTDRERIEVPVKYGLREYGTLTAADLDRVLIPVAPASPGNAPTLATGAPDSGLSPTMGGYRPKG